MYLRRKKKKTSALAAIQSQTSIAPLGMGVKKAELAVDDLIKVLHTGEAASALTTMLICPKSNRQLLCYFHEFRGKYNLIVRH